MLKNSHILAVIPARGGSKGVPNKNIKELAGKPLIAYTIEAAKASKYIDDIVVSTDSELIKKTAVQFGAEVPFLRPDSLSDDSAKSIDVVLHCISFLEQTGRNYNYVVLLQPTSPLRTNYHIDQAIERLMDMEAESVVSVCETSENPILMRVIDGNRLKEVIKYQGGNLRRQDLPNYYIFNGAVYINSKDMLINKRCFIDEDTVPYIMDKNSSIDLDTIIDFKMAEVLIKERNYV